MTCYYLEFILHTYSASQNVIKNSLREFADDLDIFKMLQDNIGAGENYKICMRTDDPTVIFDICSQFGRIKSVKIDEERSE